VFSGPAPAGPFAFSTRRQPVGAINVHEFMSLDGVIDAPTWTFEYGFDPKMGEALGALTSRCRGILLGRNTYEAFEPAWSTRTVEDDPGAPFFNDTTKYVVSGTLTDPTWQNSQVIGPYDPGTIRRLKDEVDGDLYVSGSITLVRAMLEDGLIDELHLCVYPLTRGSGPRLFPEDATPGKFSLAAAESYDNGVLYLNYRTQAA
jgi:dihydrofolate reductase